MLSCQRCSIVDRQITHLGIPPLASTSQLANNSSIPSAVIPPPSIGSGTGLNPLGQAAASALG